LHDAANFAQISISGGEIAELGGRISGYGEGMHFNWASTAIGCLPTQLQRPIDGSALQAGDVVVSLHSPTFRSNGFSKIRRVMLAAFGEDWHNTPYENGDTYGKALLAPCLIYSPLVLSLITSGIDIHGIAHITGGGVADNFSRVLRPNGLSAMLDNLHAPTPLMQNIQQIGEVSDEEAYLYWNMGNGMLLAVGDENTAQTLIASAREKGYAAQIAGTISADGKRECCLRTHKGNTLTHKYD
jgi:phosphoribosylformylglycinamidine cyclo-ligase